MKLSINDANQFSPLDLLSGGLDKLSNKIGTQLGAIEDIEILKPKYKDALVVKVVECEKHPNADKLSVCTIDDGNIAQGVKRNNEQLVTVVCGANNVRKGQLVVWLPPGSVVPSTFSKDEFVLSERDLRGIVSQGMIASPEELDLNFSNGGILVLEEGYPGQKFAEAYNLDDVVIELENKMFTHRPDCFGVIGVARELTAIMGEQFVSPDWYINNFISPIVENEELPFDVAVDTDKVPRFTAIAMKDIKVQESPIYIKSSLIKAGIKPINSVVDVSNFVMLMTAQPIHIYDYDKVAKYSTQNRPLLNVRNSVKSEKIHLLNGKTLEMQDGNCVLIATDQTPIGIGGIMGGADTEVDSNTTNIIIEVANFDMYNIRKSSMRYGLFTDAVTRNTKKQSPHQTSPVIHKTINLIEELCGGKIASSLKDYKSKDIVSNSPISITAQFINDRLGSNLSNEKIKGLLTKAEFLVDEINDDLSVIAPFWRTDILVEEDLVEEIGRLYGFDKLPVSLPVTKISISEIDRQIQYNKNIRYILASFGANELLTYNFVNRQLILNAQQSPEQAIKISNALSPNLEYYRLSITPNLIEKIHANHKNGYDEFALFEIGKTHQKDLVDEDSLPLENTRIAFVYSLSSAKAKQRKGAAYFVGKKYLTDLADKIGLNIEFNETTNNSKEAVFGPYEPSRSAEVWSNGKVIGVVGEFKENVSKSFKLPDYCCGFEISLSDSINNLLPKIYQPKSKFPIVKQDITISCPESVDYQTINLSIKEAAASISNNNLSVEYECTDIFHSDNKLNYTFAIKYQNFQRTQTVKEINNLTSKIVKIIEEKTGGVQI